MPVDLADGPVDRASLREAGLDWLLDSSFLGLLTPAELDSTLAAAQWRKHRDGDVLLQMGQVGEGVHLLVAGHALVRLPDEEDGTMRVVARLGPGHLVGERSFLLGERTNAEVSASGPLRTFHIPGDRFAELLREVPAMRAYVEDLVAIRERAGVVLDLLLREPILRALGREELETLLQAGHLVRAEPGAEIVRAGEISTDIYLVLRGEVAFFVPDAKGGESTFVATEGAGCLFGHVALLLEMPRSADVEARSQVELLRIRGHTFMELVARNPPLQRRLYQHLASLNLDRDAIQEEERVRSRTTLFWSPRAGTGATTLTYGVAAVLRGEGRKPTVVDLNGPRSAGRLKMPTFPDTIGGIEIRRLKAPSEWGVEVLWPARAADAARLVAHLAEVAGEEDRVLIASQSGASPDHDVAAHAKNAVLVRWARETSAPDALEHDGFRVEAVRIEKGVELPLATARNAVRIVTDEDTPAQFWRTGRLGLLADERTPVGRASRRLVRALTGRTVGIALGGGGALGYAHVGLIEALLESGVPLDYVAGCSFGSVVGAIYATHGLDGLRTLVKERRLLNKLVGMSPLSTGPFAWWVRRVTGARTLGETEIPYFPVAMDVWTGSEVVITRGLVSDGVRASSSFPGMFPAFRRGLTRLVDGGIVNNVPASVVWQAGAGFIIASNIVPRFPSGKGPVIRENSVRGRVESATRQRFDDTIRSVFFLMSQTGRDRASMADYIFEFDIQGYNVTDVAEGQVIYEHGLRQARNEMSGILQARDAGLDMRVRGAAAR